MNKVTLFTLFVLATSMVLDCDAMLRLDAAGQRYHRLQNKIAADRQKYSAIPREHYFTQKLDHFNHQDTRTWQQRYFVNDSFWNPALGGPVFLQIGGEGAISPGYVLTMEMVVYAQTHGALVLALEHRFYGKSQPLPDLSTPNLQYLSSQQALADVAYFISHVRSSIKGAENSQFVTFGCSYPGNLAAWFRLKYPFQTTGSVASSAPVQATLDFYEYLDVVDESLSTLMGVQCDNRIQQATDQIQSMLNTTTGRQQLQTMFSTCTPLDNELDIATFMSDLMGNWMGTVQYNDEGGNPIDINYLCGIMENDTMSALDAYIEVSNLFLQNQKASCLDISYSAMIEELQNVNSSKHGVGIRQWTYQTCFEFGYFQTTDSEGQPFGDMVPLEYWLKMCNDTFDPNGTMGINVAAHVNETNILYGGNKPHGATNILFVNGSIDPWHSLGVTSDINESTTAILIQGTAHCANTNPATPNDPPGLAMAQSQINKQISIWLMEGNQ